MGETRCVWDHTEKLPYREHCIFVMLSTGREGAAVSSSTFLSLSS